MQKKKKGVSYLKHEFLLPLWWLNHIKHPKMKGLHKCLEFPAKHSTVNLHSGGGAVSKVVIYGII